MEISTKINKYLFKSAHRNYTLFNYDYFSTDYGIPSDRELNEREEYTLMMILVNQLEKNKVIIDVGANCGLFSIPCAMKGYKVIAFEPIEMNVHLLELNKKENNCDNMDIVPFALYNETKQETIYIPYCSDNTSFNKEIAISNMGRKNFIPETVNCITFDEWFEKNPIENIGFVKIDVQGFEKNVLDGMKNFLNNCNDVKIFMEWDESHTSKAGHSLNDILKLLTDSGFEEIKSFPSFLNDKFFHKQ